jgi:hypothetical protein
VGFAPIILYVASQRAVPKISLYFVIYSVRKLLDIPSYCLKNFGSLISCSIFNLLRMKENCVEQLRPLSSVIQITVAGSCNFRHKVHVCHLFAAPMPQVNDQFE